MHSCAKDNVADWLSYGVDPKKSLIFIQSQVPAHLELFTILSALVPLGWLYRCPTFKEQIVQLKDKDVNTYAFLGYPVLQAADIILYKADCVPVGEDQLPHLELCREIVRRFHHLYGKEVFLEPQALLTKTPRFLGLDGRKMSKSYDNYISLSEDDESLTRKVLSMFTDPARKRNTDQGHPDICNVFAYYQLFDSGRCDEVKQWCTKAERGCRECKQIILSVLITFITPRREEKQALLKKKGYIEDVLEQGKNKAVELTCETLAQVKDALKL